jgi:predicted NBD/HSP70 family sugar kinase
MDTYLGLDFGGTKLLIGEVDAEGNILRSKRYETGLRRQDASVKELMADLEDYLSVGFAGNPAAVGTGVVGVVDHSKGLWVSMDHEENNAPIPLAKMLEDRLNLPAAIDNDVRSATTAELLLGHGRISKDFIYLNVGTGLAAGVVADGRILRGAHNNVGEVGHMVVDLSDDMPCVCGRRGCVENLVSGVGFTRRAEYLRDSFQTSLPKPRGDEYLDASLLFRLADQGDALCKHITDQAAKALACVIMNLARVSDPDTVILGGGVVADGWLLNKVRLHLNKSTLRGVTGGVVLSSFQAQYAGLIGAASLGMVRKAGGVHEKN